MEFMELSDLKSGERRQKVQLLRTGNFNHPQFGKFDITAKILKEFKKNFDANVRNIKLAIDFFHRAHEIAAGWIESLEIKDDSELWAEVEWSDAGLESIKRKEVKYLSVDFQDRYKDNETGEEFGYTLLGAGLTNRPFVKNMNPVFAEDDNLEMKTKKGNGMDFEQILKTIGSLTADQKAQILQKIGGNKAATEKQKELSEAKESNEALKAELSEKSSENTQLSEAINTLKKQFLDLQSENKFNLMLSEGKVVESQREAFLQGDMESFAKNAVKINLSETGSGKDSEVIDEEKAAIKLSEIASGFQKDGMTAVEAYKKAYRENLKLAEIAIS
jgi:hypothetical protein